jgi:hypothetical protein
MDNQLSFYRRARKGRQWLRTGGRSLAAVVRSRTAQRLYQPGWTCGRLFLESGL